MSAEVSSPPESLIHRFETAAGPALAQWRQERIKDAPGFFPTPKTLMALDLSLWRISLTANRYFVARQILPGNHSDSQTLFKELSAACGDNDATRQLLATAGEDDIPQMIATALYGDTPAAYKMVDFMVATARTGLYPDTTTNQKVADSEVSRRITQGEVKFGFLGSADQKKSDEYASLLGLAAAASRELTKASRHEDLGDLVVDAARELRARGEYTGVIPLPVFNQLIGQALDRAVLPAPLKFDPSQPTHIETRIVDAGAGHLKLVGGRFIQLSANKSKPIDFGIDAYAAIDQHVAEGDNRKLRVSGAGATQGHEFKVRLPADGLVGRVLGKTEEISGVLWDAFKEGRLHAMIQAELAEIFSAGGIELDPVGFGFDEKGQLTLTLESSQCKQAIAERTAAEAREIAHSLYPDTQNLIILAHQLMPDFDQTRLHLPNQLIPVLTAAVDAALSHRSFPKLEFKTNPLTRNAGEILLALAVLGDEKLLARARQWGQRPSETNSSNTRGRNVMSVLEDLFYDLNGGKLNTTSYFPSDQAARRLRGQYAPEPQYQGSSRDVSVKAWQPEFLFALNQFGPAVTSYFRWLGTELEKQNQSLDQFLSPDYLRQIGWEPKTTSTSSSKPLLVIGKSRLGPKQPEMTRPVVFAPWTETDLAQRGLTTAPGKRFLQVTGADNLGEVMAAAKALPEADVKPRDIVLLPSVRPDEKPFWLQIPLSGLRQTATVTQLIQLMAWQFEKTKQAGNFNQAQWQQALEKLATSLGTN
jgi:hypothetical protein